MKTLTTNEVGKIIEGATILRMYTPETENVKEGGLTIIFQKDAVRGIYIMGYTELGDWVYLFDFGEEYMYVDWWNLNLVNEIRVEAVALLALTIMEIGRKLYTGEKITWRTL